MIKIKIILSFLFICSLSSLQAQFREIKRTVTGSVEYGAFAPDKRWDLPVDFAVERSKIPGADATKNSEGGKRTDITKQGSRLKYTTFSVMPKFYLNHSARFSAAIETYTSTIYTGSTNWTDSNKGSRYENIYYYTPAAYRQPNNACNYANGMMRMNTLNLNLCVGDPLSILSFCMESLKLVQ